MSERDTLGVAVAVVAILATMFAVVRYAGGTGGNVPRAPAATVSGPHAADETAATGEAQLPIVTLALARAVVAPGTPVVAQVRVEAPPGTKLVLRTPTACLADLEVHDARGVVRARGERTCAPVVRTRTLADEAPLVDTVLVHGGTPGAPALAPGRYTVRAVVARITDDGTPDVLRSAPVRLDVRAR